MTLKRTWLGALATGLALTISGCTDTGYPKATSDRVVTGDLADRREARLEVVSGTTALVVRAADLNGQLFRAWTPDGSRVLPAATTEADTVRVSVRDTGGSGPAELRIELNDAVTWQVQLDGGTSTQTIDFGAGALSSLDFAAGSTRIDTVLPRPRGTVPVRMTGGASTFDLHLPADVPAKILIAGGAGQATVDGAVHNGVAGGSVLSTGDWETATDRYDLNLVAGVSALNLDRTKR